MPKEIENFDAKVEEILNNSHEPINVNRFVNICADLNSVSENFPEFQSEISELSDDASILLAMLMTGDTLKQYRMPLMAYDYAIDHPEDKKKVAELAVRFKDLTSRIKEKCPAGSVDNKIVTILENQVDYVLSDDFRMLSDMNPDYEKAFQTTFLNFPNKLFITDKKDEKGDPIYEADEERYEDMMENYKFLDQIEHRQTFLMETQIPYFKKLKTEGVTSEEEQNYALEYRGFLDKQQEYFKEIKSYSHTDKELLDNNVLGKNNGIETMLGMNWQDKRFGDMVYNEVSDTKTYLDHGWSPEEALFFREIEAAINHYSSGCEFAQEQDSKKFAPEDIEKTAENVAIMRSALERAKREYAFDPETKHALLAPFMKPLEDYYAWDKKYIPASRRVRREEHPLKKMLSDVITSSKKEYNSSLQRNITVEFQGRDVLDTVPYDLDYAVIADNIGLMLEDLNAVDPSKMISSGAFRDYKNSLINLLAAANDLKNNNFDDESLGVEDHPTSIRQARLTSFRSELMDTLQKGKDYLDYKQDQFRKDPTRRDSKKRQKNEQPRINTVIKQFDKLNRIANRIEEYATNGEGYRNSEPYPSARETYYEDLVSTQSKQAQAAQERILMAYTIDVNRLSREYPHIRNIDYFKLWYATEFKDINTTAYTDEMWQDLYNAEVINSSEKGMLPDAEVVTNESLREGMDPVIPESRSVKTIATCYGAKPVLVTEWLGSGDGTQMVYSRDEYIKNNKQLDPGSFTNDEFGILAYYAAQDPNIIKGDISLGTVKPEDLSHEDLMLYNSYFYTAEFYGSDSTNPRYSLGTHYYDVAITPAREATAAAIAEYENGNIDPLVDIIANGMKLAVMQVKSSTEISKPELHIIEMMNQLIKVASKDEKLEEAVIDKLNAKEMEEVRVLQTLKKLCDDKRRAQDRMNKAEAEGKPLSYEEKAKCLATISTFDHYNKIWKDNFVKYNTSPEIVAINNELYEATTKGADASKQKALSAKSKIHLMKNVELDETMVNELSDLETVKDHFSAPYGQVESLRSAYNGLLDDIAKLDELRKVEIREGEEIKRGNRTNYSYTPEQSVEYKKQDADLSYKLDQLKNIIVDQLNDEILENVEQKFNAEAKKKGFKSTFKARKGSYKAQLASIPSGEDHRLFMNIILDELEAHTDLIKPDIEDRINNLRNPRETSLEGNVDFEYQGRIDELKEKVRRENAQDLADGKYNADQLEDILDQVNLHLATRKDDVYKYMTNYYDRQHAGAMIDTAAGNKTFENYKGGKYNGIIVEKEVGGHEAKINVTNPERVDDLNEFIKDVPQPSDDLIKKISAIAAKMKEYGIVTGDSPLEQTTKIYGQKKLFEAKRALEAAVKKGDINEILRANEVFETESEHMREIFGMIKEAFPSDTFAPGNVDTIRNKDIPPEFSLDMVTDSRMNGIFQVAEQAEKFGVSVEEYMKNPGQYLMKSIDDGLEEVCFEAVTEDCNDFFSSFNKLYNMGAQHLVEKHLMKATNNVEADMSNARSLDGFMLLEPDEAKRQELLQYKMGLNKIADIKLRNEQNALNSVYSYTTATKEDIGAALYQQHRDCMKAAFISGDPIKRSKLAVPELDDNGVVQENYVDYMDDLLGNYDYDDIIKLFNDNLEAAKNCPSAEMKAMIEEVLFDYLMAHPLDVETEKFKELEALALSAGEKLENNYMSPMFEEIERPVDKYRTWKSSIDKELVDLKQDVHERDLEVNLTLSKLQKSYLLEAKANGINSEKIHVIEDKMHDIINERLIELADGWRHKEVTPSYLKARYEQLNTLDKNLRGKIVELPPFVDNQNSETLEEDYKMINDRVTGHAWEGHLQNLDRFKEWKLKSDPLLEEGELTDEDWQMIYHNEIRRQKLDTELPDDLEEPERKTALDFKNERMNLKKAEAKIEVEEVVRNETKEEAKERSERERQEEKRKEQIKGTAEEMAENLVGRAEPNQEKIISGAGVLANMLKERLQKSLFQNGPKLSDPDNAAEAENTLAQRAAEYICYDIVDKRGGKVPGTMGMQHFIAVTMNDPSFRKIIKPYLNAVAKEAREYLDSGKEEDLPENNSVNNFINKLEDRTIINAVALEQRKLLNEQNKNMTQNKDTTKNKNKETTKGHIFKK